jgi:hypothetical protein
MITLILAIVAVLECDGSLWWLPVLSAAALLDSVIHEIRARKRELVARCDAMANVVEAMTRMNERSRECLARTEMPGDVVAEVGTETPRGG